jgi:hypothetical protein
MDFSPDGRNRSVQNLPIKVVFFVQDPKSFVTNIGAKGGSVVSPALPQASLGNITIGFGKDPDGYLLEVDDFALLAALNN